MNEKIPDENRGWYEKYIITKANGNPVDPDAVYFVLRIDKDPAARAALRKYAEKTANEALAKDCIVMVENNETPEETRIAEIEGNQKAIQNTIKKKLDTLESILEAKKGKSTKADRRKW